MEKQSQSHAALIVAIVLLLLPVLYVGSYLVLLEPFTGPDPIGSDYRWGGKLAEFFYWPLEQIDRKARPNAWPIRVEAGPDYSNPP